MRKCDKDVEPANLKNINAFHEKFLVLTTFLYLEINKWENAIIVYFGRFAAL